MASNDKKSREDRGREASVKGFANEHIVAGILMKEYHNVSLVDLPLSSYDLIIVFESGEDGEETIIRAQVKTVSAETIGFTGGSRGGVDRTYKSGIKTYVQNTKTSDLVIGIKELENGSFDLYFVPTILIEKIGQKSISINRINPLKNNADILENCKNHEYILRKCVEYQILANPS